MSANDLIPFWEQKIKNGRLAAILNSSNFVIFKWLKKMQNSWTMNIKIITQWWPMINFALIISKMVASRPFQIFVLIVSEVLHDSWSKNFRSLILHIHYIPLNNFWLHFDSHIINPLITRATNKEILFSAFNRKKFPADRLFVWLICTAMSANDLIILWEQMILKLPFFEFERNFVIFT